jgi:hypothetical protein
LGRLKGTNTIFGGPSNRWEDNIKSNLIENGTEGRDSVGSGDLLVDI